MTLAVSVVESWHTNLTEHRDCMNCLPIPFDCIHPGHESFTLLHFWNLAKLVIDLFVAMRWSGHTNAFILQCSNSKPSTCRPKF